MQKIIKYIANQENKNYGVEQSYNQGREDSKSFTQALEELEGWIFYKITKSLWWQVNHLNFLCAFFHNKFYFFNGAMTYFCLQTLAPNIQFVTAKTSTTRGSRVKKTYGSRHSLGDQVQGKFLVKLWNGNGA